MKIYNPNIVRFLTQSKLDKISQPKPENQQDLKLLKLKKACRDFEAIFISYMLKAMNKTTENSELFGDGLGGDIYREIFNEKLAEHISQTGQFKIGDLIYQKYAGIIKQGNEVPNSEIAKATAEINPQLNNNHLRAITPVSPEPDHTKTEVRIPVVDNDKEIPSTNSTGITDSLSVYHETIDKAAKEYGVDASLIKAVIRQESGGDPRAISHKGAKGLMQLIDSTAAMVGVTDPFNPVENIMGGAKYLSLLIRRFEGDLKKALASYNAGPAAVEKYGGVPPFKETVRYVEDVLSNMSSE